MKNGTILLTSIVSFGVAYSIMMGTAQKYVHFAGELNELGCTVIALTMGIISLYGLDWKGLGKWLIS
jgi:hypothetical protein